MSQPEPRPDLLVSRRVFVQAGAGATAIAALGGLGPLEPAMAAGAPAHLRRSGYADLVGTTFVAGGVELRLESIGDLVRARTEPRLAGSDDAFALTLVGRPGLDGAIHPLSHERLGAFSLFVSPVGEAGQRQRYEVVVDRAERQAAATAQAPGPLARANAESASDPAPAPPGAVTAGGPRDERVKAGPRLVLGALVARRGGVLSADVRVARNRGLRAVQVVLAREGIVYARGFRRLGERVGVRVALRELVPTRPGDYWLHVTTTDRHGRRSTSKRRAALH